ncbi:MAG: hypothetical protein IMZ61_10230 [Planctomycetes bacterium]|nr:hypothetical protein [Planctomycetota bacterium]
MLAGGDPGFFVGRSDEGAAGESIGATGQTFGTLMDGQDGGVGYPETEIHRTANKNADTNWIDCPLFLLIPALPKSDLLTGRFEGLSSSGLL